MCSDYSKLFVEKIIQSPFVEGTKDFLDYFSLRIQIYQVSVNSENDLNNMLEAKGIKEYFKKVYAHPRKKTESITDIMLKEDISSENVIFVGDAIEDYQAAA